MSDETPDSPDAKPEGDGNPPDEPEAIEPEPEPEPHVVVAALQATMASRFELEGEDQCGTPIIRVDADQLVELMTAVRDQPDLRMNYLSSVTAVDWTEREPRFDVVYHLYSIPNNLRLTVKTGCADGEGVATMVDVWPAANWLERETFDLYGIEFLGHPDLRRIFLPEDWEGFPLRKDYPLEGPNLDLLTRQQAAFRGGHFDRIRGEYEMTDQEREMAAPGLVGALWTPAPPVPEVAESEQEDAD